MQRIFLAICLFHQFSVCVTTSGLVQNNNATLAAFVQQTKTAVGEVTVTLSNLTNRDGVLSNTLEPCDEASDCDTFVVVSVGSYDMGSDILTEAKTEPKVNHNNLPFVFFSRTFAMNTSSLQHPLHIRILAMDDHMTGDQEIGTFSHVVRLKEPNSTHAVLYSTLNNKAVSLELSVSIVCREFFYGPDCSRFCQPGAHGKTRCSKEGMEVCLDGTADCQESPVRERSAVAKTSLSESQDLSVTFYWAIPSACLILALIIALATLVAVKIVRTRSVQVLVITNEHDGAVPPDAKQQQQQQQQQLLINSPSPANSSQSESPATGESPPSIANQQQLQQWQSIDASKFRNPIYARYPHHKYLRSSSTNTQSSVATDATDLATSTNDEYEDLDAFHPQTPPQPRLSPSSRRLLPPRPNEFV